MTIAQIILAIARAIETLMQVLRDSAQRRAGEAQAMARYLTEQIQRVRKARAARDAVRDDRMPDDDPYRRD
jgi:hypothetical protein